jgi:hypothetical protein
MFLHIINHPLTLFYSFVLDRSICSYKFQVYLCFFKCYCWIVLCVLVPALLQSSQRGAYSGPIWGTFGASLGPVWDECWPYLEQVLGECQASCGLTVSHCRQVLGRSSGTQADTRGQCGCTFKSSSSLCRNCPNMPVESTPLLLTSKTTAISFLWCGRHLLDQAWPKTRLELLIPQFHYSWFGLYYISLFWPSLVYLLRNPLYSLLFKPVLAAGYLCSHARSIHHHSPGLSHY